MQVANSEWKDINSKGGKWDKVAGTIYRIDVM